MLKLLRSTSVRLALGYAALFAVSSLLLVGLLWWRTAGYLERETDAVISADAQEIRDQLRRFGLAAAEEAIRERIAEAPRGPVVYLLADRDLQPLAGNLRAWPAPVKPEPGWYQLDILRDGRVQTIRLREVTLSMGAHLLVGRDVGDLAEIRALIVDGLGWAAAGIIVLAVAGGMLVRRAVLRRVEIINRTASAIVRGDLSRRLPTRDTVDEFDQLAQTVNLMLQQIEDLIEGVRNTSNAVAHDLRTPLAELRAELEELTRARPSREAILDGVYKAVADIDRVIAIFNALLRLAEIDSGLRRSAFRRVELAELATEVAELYAPLTEEKDVAFAVEAGAGLAVTGDSYLLAQAVANLVDNAVKYTPSHGAISLRIAPCDDGRIDIAVADSGPGIADADKPRVTARFYRCQSSGKTAGIGLGLSVVEAVARLHDGTLTLTDNHPGLVASLKLPVLLTRKDVRCL